MNTAKQDSVLMIAPGDTEPGLVPKSRVNELRSKGAVLYRPNEKAFFDTAPASFAAVGAGLGRFAGSRKGGGGTKKNIFQGAGSFLGGMTGKAAQEIYYRTHGLGDAPGSMLDEIPIQAGYAAAGVAAPHIISKGGEKLFAHTLPQAALPEVKQAAKTMHRERIPVGSLMDIEGLTNKYVPFLRGKVSGEAVRKIPVVGPWLVKGTGVKEGRPGRQAGEAYRHFVQVSRVVRKNVAAMERQGVVFSKNDVLKPLKAQIYKHSRGVDYETSNRLKSLLAELDANLPDQIKPKHLYEMLIQQGQKASPIMASLKAAPGSAIPLPSEHTASGLHANVIAETAKHLFSNVPGAFGEKFRGTRRALSDAMSIKKIAEVLHGGAAPELKSVGYRLGSGAAGGALLSYLSGNRHGNDYARNAAIGSVLLANPTAASRILLMASDPVIRQIIASSPQLLFRGKPSGPYIPEVDSTSSTSQDSTGGR